MIRELFKNDLMNRVLFKKNNKQKILEGGFDEQRTLSRESYEMIMQVR
jgi:hypothetical protein